MLILQNPDVLLNLQEAGPYVSLYQPTHRQHPDNKQDPILFRNLLKNITESLSAAHSKESIATLLAPFHELAEDADFWNHTSNGIAMFAARDFFRIKAMH